MLTRLELLIPPPILAALTGALMWLVANGEVASNQSAALWIKVLTSILVLTGCLLGGDSVVRFVQSKTTINPHAPEKTRVLVTSGIYRITRNPMYLGLLCFLLAWGIWLAEGVNGLVLLPVPFFIVYMNRFQIEPEERVLEATFEGEYLSYKQRARRWL